MASLERSTPGVMQPNAIVEIDPGPRMGLQHRLLVLEHCTDSLAPLRCELNRSYLDEDNPRYTALSYTWGDHQELPHSQMALLRPRTTVSTRAARLQSPPASVQCPVDQELEHLSVGEYQPTGIGYDGKLARGTGGITFNPPEYACPFTSMSTRATREEETFGSWIALCKHLTDTHLHKQSFGPYAIGKGSDNDGTPGQATSLTSPGILPPPAHHSMTVRPLCGAGSVGSGEHVLHRLSRPVELLHSSYADLLGGTSTGGLIALALLRAAENVSAPQVRQTKWLDEYPKGTKQPHEERKWSRRRVLHAHDTLDGGAPAGTYHLIFGEEQHASLRSGLGGTSLIDADVLLEEDPDATRLKVWPARLSANNIVLDRYDTRAMEVLVNNPIPIASGTETETESRMRNGFSTSSRSTAARNWVLSRRKVEMVDSSSSVRFMGPEATRCLRTTASTSWAAGPLTNSDVDVADVSLRDILMWMIEYNLINSPSESEPLSHLWYQSTQLLFNLVAAAISCFHVQFSPMVPRTNARAKQCTGTVHCLLEDPG